jgi:hypothetical protein
MATVAYTLEKAQTSASRAKQRKLGFEYVVLSYYTNSAQAPTARKAAACHAGPPEHAPPSNETVGPLYR